MPENRGLNFFDRVGAMKLPRALDTRARKLVFAILSGIAGRDPAPAN